MSSRSSKSDPSSAYSGFITVGRVRKPHGIRGEVTVDVLSDVEKRFAPRAIMDLVLSNGSRRTAVMSSVRGKSEGPIIHFEGCDSRDQAEELRGAVLQIDSSSVPKAPEGTFYFFELIGCACIDEVGGRLGRVEMVLDDGGGLLLEIVGESSTMLVPFVEAYLREVDTVERRIALQLPEGLIETCTSRS
jgi:16S rRNA processing protein RimM